MFYKLSAVATVLLAFALGTAAAQESGGGSRSSGSGTTATSHNDDRGFNMGWLGLAGLAGLAGLMPRDRGNRNGGNAAGHNTAR